MKKRVCDLLKGDIFLWHGVLYKITSISNRIYYRYFDGQLVGGYDYSFGRKNQMWVELIVD